MKIKYFLLMASILAIGCASLKAQLNHKGGRQEAIQNAIMDFSNTCKLYKSDTVFSVSSQDTVCKMILEKLDGRNYKWINGEFYEDILAISISANYNRFLLTKDTKVGSKGKLPSRFIEKEGKLFYWWDDDYPLTKEALAVFERYNLLQDDEGGLITVPDFTINDAQKAAHYYFCKNDLSKYKRVITNKGIGYYEPPKLRCK